MTGNPMVILQRKLKRMKQSLKDFNKAFYADISTKVKVKRDELAGIQGTLLDNPNRNDLVQLERKLTHELYELMVAKEIFLSKNHASSGSRKGIRIHLFFIRWLQQGRVGTQFLHC